MSRSYGNYRQLADAIIMQAVKDYMRSKCYQVQEEIESFFKSDWFIVLCNIDGDWLIEKLKQERVMKNG